MASLKCDRRSGNWCIKFRFDGIQYHRSCHTEDESIAETLRGNVQETISFLSTGRLTIPDGADPAEWILTGGKVERKRKEPEKIKLRFREICDA